MEEGEEVTQPTELERITKASAEWWILQAFMERCKGYKEWEEDPALVIATEMEKIRNEALPQRKSFMDRVTRNGRVK